MLSSHRIIKATHAYKTTKSTIIDTLIEEPEEVQMAAEEEVDDASLQPAHIREARLESEAILQEATIESKHLVEAAQKEAEQLREAAQEEGYQTGLQTGYQEGLQKGFAEGMEQAQKDIERMKLEAKQLLQEAHEEIQRYQSEKKDELLDLAVKMAEKLIHNQLEESRDGILELAKPYLYQLDKEEEYVTLTVHPNQLAFVRDHLDDVKAIAPGTRFMVLPDADLETDGVMIESSRAVVDLQVKKQLDGMLKELKEMERIADV
ncbi:FliH/SctL family protein [Atopococcus tabaci]|uniref:FliH/SctL family protein n=1 Tax=Atopococcus tabaci TaxID=269774 RepID=UPI000413A929|nr:FliH/SctL family protein [Atopococcus tabaci]